MNNIVIVGVFFLGMLFSIINIYSSDLPELFLYGDEWMSFLNGISLGLISAIIFYFFQNYLPQKHKKTIVKKNFMESYKYFKLNVIQIFLWVIKEEYGDNQELLDVEKFRDFFTDERWTKLVNEIENEENEELFNDLIFEIELLHKKINILLLSIDLPNDVLAFFHRLDETFYKLQYIKKDTERYQNDYKYFWRTLWSTFSSWSFVDGYKKYDHVEENIEKV